MNLGTENGGHLLLATVDFFRPVLFGKRLAHYVHPHPLLV